MVNKIRIVGEFPMKKTIFTIIVIAMLGWSVYEFAFPETKTAQEDNEGGAESSEGAQTKEIITIEDEEGLEQGNIAPDFKLKTLDGEVVKLSDFRGEQIMLNFWATWCPPCRAEMPDLQKLYEEKDVVILAVNLLESEESIEDVEQFVEDFTLTFPIVLDSEGNVAKIYQIQPIPTSYMIDEEGRIQNKAIGPLNYELMVQVFDMMK